MATTYAPFVDDGQRVVVERLQRELGQRKHDVDAVWIPFQSSPRTAAEQVLALRCLELSEASGNKIDVLIALNPPATALRHPHKVAWLLGTQADASCAWGLADTRDPGEPEAARIHGMLKAAERQYLSEAKTIWTSCEALARRLEQDCGIRIEGVMTPPEVDAKWFPTAGAQPMTWNRIVDSLIQ